MNARGFTLVELLVTIAVIGVLAAIATMQFNEFKKRGYDARANSNLHDGIAAQEAYYVDNERYVTCANSECNTLLPGFERSQDVVISFKAKGGGVRFTGEAYHLLGGMTYSYKSATGRNKATKRTVASVPGGPIGAGA